MTTTPTEEFLILCIDKLVERVQALEERVKRLEDINHSKHEEI